MKRRNAGIGEGLDVLRGEAAEATAIPVRPLEAAAEVAAREGVAPAAAAGLAALLGDAGRHQQTGRGDRDHGSFHGESSSGGHIVRCRYRLRVAGLRCGGACVNFR
jgi:hypothetical protein